MNGNLVFAGVRANRLAGGLAFHIACPPRQSASSHLRRIDLLQALDDGIRCASLGSPHPAVGQAFRIYGGVLLAESLVFTSGLSIWRSLAARWIAQTHDRYEPPWKRSQAHGSRSGEWSEEDASGLHFAGM